MPFAVLTLAVTRYILPLIKESPSNDFAFEYATIATVGYFFAAHFDLTRRYLNAKDSVFLPIVS